MKLLPQALAALLLFLTPSSLAAQAVHVVDASNGPGTDFTTIAAAITAAAPGDALLIRTGSYGAPVINGKPLILQADTGASVDLIGLDIRNIAAGDSVCLFGLTIRGCTSNRLFLLTNPGNVWLEECEVYGGLTLTSSDSVVMTRCQTGTNVEGLCSLWNFNTTNSSLYLYDCEVNGAPVDGANGMPGITQTGGLIYAHGTTITGGDGLPAIGGNCLPGTAGGAGILVTGTPSAQIDLLGSTITGGMGCAAGQAMGIVDGSGGGATITNFPGRARSAFSPSPVREQQTTSITYTGVPGDRVRMIYASAPGPAMQNPAVTGYIFTPLTTRSFFAGTIDATGTLAQTVPIGTCSPGVKITSLYGQPLFFNPGTGEIQIATALQFHLLDRSL